ncbi:MAG: serine/threonine-protein kinase [Acidobacteriota bacterium]|nr:serine/threonine-protein kinase [Acidobacteriota bacterium]
MAPDEWDKAVEVFHAARERSGGEQVALLDSLCGRDSSLRVLIEQMLRDDQAPGSFLDRVPIEAFADSRGPRVAAGAKFGRYDIVALTGRGGMGEVWMARDTELGRLVALKFLASTGFSRDAERLTHEAMAASALNHPNIVTVHEVIRHEDTPVIVMELVEGTSLRAVGGSPLPLDRLIHYALQIVRALAVAHGSGLVHCDIKPENILLRPDGYIKIVDFGLARRTAIEPGSAGSGGLTGTLRYMSPEQARGELLTPASDVFSFGLVLYELATGGHAFPVDSPLQVIDAILNQQPASHSSVNPALPERLSRLIMRMLAKEPAVRPDADSVARELTALERALEERGLRWEAWLALGILLAGLAGLAVWKLKKPSLAAEVQWLARPLTSDPGDEMGASFSPDGKRVAFAWRHEDEDVFNLYTLSIEGGAPQPLIESASNDFSPAWSPDGKDIAFIEGKERAPASILLVPASGGSPRMVAPVLFTPWQEAVHLDWSPDGKWLVLADREP